MYMEKYVIGKRNHKNSIIIHWVASMYTNVGIFISTAE
jgi:hypothetical protein